ncbi:MAG: Hsp33 family molecular chaperone HslO [Lachnospiraceae bacterium]|nr:Hsp33 family molecular chaperone HslO [Lachnospiraceae bacterium]MDY3729823.1 Hsp33 family molecular chaperone HslO [Candidatus Choladocola sp.]
MKEMDYIVRATAADQQIRAFAATTRDMVETARSYHNTSPVATAALGRLLTAGAMMGAMMKGEKDILTLQIKGNGPIGGITVTADSKANVKGYVQNPEVMIHANEKGKLDVGGAIGIGILNVIKDLGMKEPYVGQCELKTGEIGDDLTYYFAVSEQVPSSVGLGVLMEKNNTVKQAGGFIIQLMPFTSEEVIDKLEKKLSEVTSVTSMLDQGMTPEEILQELLGEFGLEIMDTIPTQYHCDCSKERIERALISIGKKDLQEMIDAGETIEVGCQFCNKKYHVTVEELRELLKKSSR